MKAEILANQQIPQIKTRQPSPPDPVTNGTMRILSALMTIVLSLATLASVPKPYTPIETSADHFDCLLRSTDLGPLLLPKQISAAGKPLLVEPISLAGLGDTQGFAKLLSNDGNCAKWRWTGKAGGFDVQSDLTADCDGFCWYEIRLTPRHAATLPSLSLEIPRIAATARYLHTSSYNWSNVSGGLPELGGSWGGAFVPYVWLGDEARGLAWCAESEEGWKLRDPSHAMAVATKGDVVTTRIRLVDHAETISSPLVFKFGLQATPVKPVGFTWRAKARICHDIHYESADAGPDGKCELDRLRDGGVRTAIIHDSWTAYFGQMAPADPKRFRKLIDACHSRGMRLLVYVGYGVARTAPELQGKHDLWSVIPLIPWDPGYKPETRGFDATCSRSGWADWLIAGVDKLFTDYDLDGLYFDGTSEAWVCENSAHGCGWRDAAGKLHPDYPILSARRLMRDIADTVHRHKPDGILDVHMSSNMTMPTLSFCDSAWNGEQFEGHTSAEKFTVPLAAFRTEFMGYAHGIDTEFLCYENRPFTFTEAIALAWVHGVEVRPYPQNLHYVTPIWRAMDRFNVADAKWLPYWTNPPATADDVDTKISAWARDGKALLFVSHLSRKPATVRVRLNSAVLKTAAGAKVRDAISGQALDGSNLTLGFKGMDYRIIEIAP